MSSKSRYRPKNRRSIETSQDRLARNFLAEHGQQETILVHNPQGVRKMSEVLLDFAQPLLDNADNFESQQKAIIIAALAWNLSLSNPVSRMFELRKLFREVSIGASTEDFKQVLKGLIIRKKEKFSDVRRLILDWKLIRSNGRLHLDVVS